MNALIFMVALIPSCLSVIAAAYMAVYGISGWGWFLFVGVILGGASYSTSGSKE